MRRIALVFLFILANIVIQAQANLDSLYSIWEDPAQTDSTRLMAYKKYIWEGSLFSEPDSALLLVDAMHAFAQEHDYPKATNQAYTLQGVAYDMKGEFSLAMDYIQKSITANEAIGNKYGLSEAEIVMGVLFIEQGDYPRALEHYQKALAIDEEIGNKKGMAMSLNNIGNIYNSHGNSTRALEYYQQALVIDEELGEEQGVATELSNIGNIYNKQGNTIKALEYLKKSLQITQKIGDKYGIGTSYVSIGDVYQLMENDPLALENYEKGLIVLNEIGMRQEVAQVQTTLGQFYLSQGKERLALDYCQQSYDSAKEIGAITRQRAACACLYRVYKNLGNTRKALTNFEEMVALKDSIYNEENTRELTRLQMQYEFDKKEAATKAAQEKKDALALEELQRQKLVRNGFIGGFAVVLLFAGVFFIQRNRIGKEKQRSEDLLLNILPKETARELKEKGQSDAQLIDQVTVLFTDFKEFTAMSEMLSPEDLVNDLHLCFSHFDLICEKYGIEKIKTIGDAYMAAGGLPVPNSTHAQNVVQAAIEMAKVVEQGKAKKIAAGLPYFKVRIGIHSGPVVAGIVGVKKFQYDIWGDTVNTASRMESSGEVGQVNISQSTYELLKDDSDLAFESRGKIETKGKGAMKMYFVSKA